MTVHSLKKRKIAILIIFLMIANMLSPYGILLKESYAGEVASANGGIGLTLHNYTNENTVSAPASDVRITPPTDVNFEHGAELTYEGGSIVLIYSDNTESAPIAITADMVTETIAGTAVDMEPDADEYGADNTLTKNLTIKYTAEGVGEVTSTYNIILTNSIDAVEFKETPKTNYLIGEEMQDIKLTVTRKAGNTEEITITKDDTDKVSGFDTSAVTETAKEVTVTYAGEELKFDINVTEPIKTITVHPNNKTTYFYGDELYLTGVTIDVLKENGTSETGKEVTSSMVSGYNSEPEAGTLPSVQTITVTYGSDKDGNPVTDTFQVTVVDYIEKIEVENVKTEYNYNDQLDKTQGTIKVTMASKTEVPAVALNNADVTINGYNKTVLGNQTVKVKYGQDKDGNDIEAEFTVNVSDVKTGIVINVPTTTTYKYGETLDLSTGRIVESWLSGAADTEKNINIDMVTDDGNLVDENSMKPTTFNSNYKATKTFVITYDGVTEDYTVTIVNDIKGITIKEEPKTTYNYGDALDKTQGSIEVERADGSKEEIPLTDARVSFEGFDTSAEREDVPVTVKFTENGNERITGFTIDVKDDISAIALVGTPKTDYKYGDNLDIDGLTLTVTRPSGVTPNVPVTMDMINGYNSTIIGSQTVVISYGGQEVSYDVNVADFLSNVRLTKPDQVTYKLNESPLDLTGALMTEISASGVEGKQVAVTSLV